MLKENIDSINVSIASPLKPGTHFVAYVLSLEGKEEFCEYMDQLLKTLPSLWSYSTECGMTEDIIRMTFDADTPIEEIKRVMADVRTTLENHIEWFLCSQRQ